MAASMAQVLLGKNLQELKTVLQERVELDQDKKKLILDLNLATRAFWPSLAFIGTTPGRHGSTLAARFPTNGRPTTRAGVTAATWLPTRNPFERRTGHATSILPGFDDLVKPFKFSASPHEFKVTSLRECHELRRCLPYALFGSQDF
jgi:hypothetical protein